MAKARQPNSDTLLPNHFEHYIQSIDSSGKRSRLAVVIIVIGSVLSAIALLNAWRYGWPQQRIIAATTDWRYAAYKYGFIDDPHLDLKEARDQLLQSKRIVEVFDHVNDGAAENKDCNKQTREAELRVAAELKAMIDPGQSNAAEGHGNIPAGQANAPGGQVATPGTQMDTPGGQLRTRIEEWERNRQKKNAAIDAMEIGEQKVLAEKRKTEAETKKKTTVEEAQRELRAALVRSYIDNAMSIRLPFFGIAFDVSDLGLVAGVGFVVILFMLRYSLHSEYVALSVGFSAVNAVNSSLFREFYEVLASRQVLTVPQLPPELAPIERTSYLINAPRIIIALPVVVYSLIFATDLMTITTGNAMSGGHTIVLLLYTMAFLVLVAFEAFNCLTGWSAIDRLWEAQWEKVQMERRELNQ